LLSTKALPNGDDIETQAKRKQTRKRKKIPDDTSRYCSGKVITSLELQAELTGIKGGKILITKE